ncbi:MAG: MBL fold metallo-hydrolase [Candidatus Bathyarchaeota archaeon]|nr:MAG: MBL fold metallo-hydrolase [Candidatus Bathyarchaeota archaeon]
MGDLRIVFLGTGGGRFATITQKRRTAGVRFLKDELNLHLDPGPGALVYSWMLGLDPRKINGIIVSHAHPDHYNDAEVLIEAMARGALKRQGILAAARSVLKGGETAEVAISKYHQSLPKQVVETVAGTEFEIKDVKIKGFEARHSDVDAVGFRFETEVGAIGYTSDTEFFEEIEGFYRGVRMLILCVLRPSGEPWQGHMTTDDAIEIVKATEPEFVVLTHFGMKMIFRGPTREARMMERETGAKVVPATDGMELWIGEEIAVGKAIDKKGKKIKLNKFLKT